MNPKLKKLFFATLIVFTGAMAWNYLSEIQTKPTISREEYVRQGREAAEKILARAAEAELKSKPTPTPTPVRPGEDVSSKPKKVIALGTPQPSPTPIETRRVKATFADLETSEGLITIKLQPEKAPKTVKNFIRLSEEPSHNDNLPFYRNMQFFRIRPDFFIQTGDPTNAGTNHIGFFEKDELNIRASEVTVGMVLMARVEKYTSKNQFYIAVGDMDKMLLGQNTVFGVVTAGLDVARKISKEKTDIFDKPLNPVVVKSIKIRRLYEDKKTH